MNSIVRRWLVVVALSSFACVDLALEPHPPLTGLQLSPDNELVLTGDTLVLTVTAVDGEGETVPVPSWTPVHWSTSDESIAVTPDGRLVGNRGSRATIVANVAGLAGGTSVRINPRELNVEVLAVVSQAAQRLDGRIPLIEGRDAILRVFVTSKEVNYYESVDVQAALQVEGGAVWQSPILETGSDSIEANIVDDLTHSYFHSLPIPGSHIRHGASLTVTLDPLGKLPTELELVPNRATTALQIVRMPVHRQMVVPTIATGGGSDERVLEWVDGLTGDSHHLSLVRTVLPVHELDVAIHEPFRTDANLNTQEGWIEWIEAIDAMRVAEGRSGWHYLGVFSPTYSRGIAGVAVLGGYSATAMNIDWVVAHEVGHNFGLMHAPCAVPGGIDPAFPYRNGVIGGWGFDLTSGTIHNPRTYDVMGYCPPPHWISDYHFGKALRHRLRRSGRQFLEKQPSVLVWGTVDEDGIELRPAFRLNTIPELPTDDGDYVLAGIGPDDEVLFENRFTPRAVAGASGQGVFHFAIPHVGDIDRIVVLGPEGRDEIGHGTEQPMSMAWQGAQIVGIYRQSSPRSLELSGSTRSVTRVIISDGVPR